MTDTTHDTTHDTTPFPKHPFAVDARDVSKCFTLQRDRAGDLRELMTGMFRTGDAPVREPFYALRDVSFRIAPGERVGIVGHNGSGKSTLLKLLTKIMKPDTGTVRTWGRIGALIEVGAGFHPDLSGRENIFLNGSIMGLSRAQIARKLDEIVAFAGLERFIDTAVKRYSSGMYMRLGFSIATHIEPDVLLIDEVLAVGDTQFQNKCLRRLREFSAGGGTVIFVSHSMGQVASLCERCLWLDRGRLLHDGPTEQAIDKYMAVVAEREAEEFRRTHPEDWEAQQAERQRQQEAEASEAMRHQEIAKEAALNLERQELAKNYRRPDRCRLLGVVLKHADGRDDRQFTAGESVRILLSYRFTRALPCPAFCIEIFRKIDGLHMFTTSNFDHGIRFSELPAEGFVRFDVPFLSLNEGEYTIRLRLYSDWRVGAWDEVLEDEVCDAATLNVLAGQFSHGCVYIPVQWDTMATEAPPAAPSDHLGNGFVSQREISATQREVSV